tara:strand:- start:432 stop:1082 length:651 start_codon:yes stop_codon:yes gene_type:complete
MAYSNFMDSFRGPHGGFGQASWRNAAAAGYNPTQIKTAIQQQARNNNASVGEGLRVNYMQGVPGIAANPLSQFQGAHGNFGLTSYNAAKASGLTTAEIGANIGSSGMFMPSGSMNQYNQELSAQAAEEQAKLQAQYQADMDKWKAEFQAAQTPTIQRSGNPGAVGKPAAGMKIAKGDDYSGRNRGSGDLNRDSAYFMNNLGGLGSATAAVSSLNIG